MEDILLLQLFRGSVGIDDRDPAVGVFGRVDAVDDRLVAAVIFDIDVQEAGRDLEVAISGAEHLPDDRDAARGRHNVVEIDSLVLNADGPGHWKGTRAEADSIDVAEQCRQVRAFRALGLERHGVVAE